MENTVDIITADYLDQAYRLEQLMDSLEVVIKNMLEDTGAAPGLAHHRDTVKELKDKIMDLGPLVDKIMEDIEEL